jgi:hypothetical protein
MAGGDETILGPYNNNAAGHVAAGAAMDAAWVNAADTYTVIMGAGNLQFSIIHIAGG